MKKYIIPILLVSGVMLSACVGGSTTTTSSEDGSPAIEEKQGDTTKTGVLVKQGEKYYIKESTGAMEEVESYTADFTQFENQAVSVTGQYSGDTLFVGTIILAVE